VTAHAASGALPARSPEALSTIRRYLAYSGPGTLIAVGYIDPGNWATDIAGGSTFGYELLSVVVASSLVAILFQTLSARLGIATGSDLATLCRETAPRTAWLMWGAAELAIVATDFAEVLGSALALHLLFGMPLAAGVVVTAIDVGFLLILDRRGMKWLERVVTSLLVLVASGLVYEVCLARPEIGALMHGLLPTTRIVREPAALFMAIGILGATVMPHNLYLHSSLVQQRHPLVGLSSPRERVRHASVDTAVSLGVAMVLNGILLAIAAAAFHANGRVEVTDIADAHRLLAPLLGSRLAPLVFAIALLAAAQSATITGTVAGQVVMTGFLGILWPAWKRRVVTRACAIVPALVLVALKRDTATGSLLVGSQVVLSAQLPFAMVPLMWLTSDRRRMGEFVSSRPVRVLGWLCVGTVIAANVALLVSMARGFCG
jgi:manganese transport protein